MVQGPHKGHRLQRTTHFRPMEAAQIYVVHHQVVGEEWFGCECKWCIAHWVASIYIFSLESIKHKPASECNVVVKRDGLFPVQYTAECETFGANRFWTEITFKHLQRVDYIPKTTPKTKQYTTKET